MKYNKTSSKVEFNQDKVKKKLEVIANPSFKRCSLVNEHYAKLVNVIFPSPLNNSLCCALKKEREF